MSRAVTIGALAVVLLAGCKERPGALVDEQQKKKPASKPAPEEPPADTDAAVPRGCKTELVRQAVKPHLDKATRCYRQVLARNPKAAGRLAVEIHLSRAGKARFLGAQADDFGDEAFTRCLFDVLRPIQYPLPEDEQCVIVYPFSFSAGPPR